MSTSHSLSLRLRLTPHFLGIFLVTFWMPDTGVLQAQDDPNDGSGVAEVLPGVPDYSKQTGYVGASPNLEQRPKVLWKFRSQAERGPNDKTPMKSLTRAVVADGEVFFSEIGYPSTIYSVRASDGVVVWEYEDRASVVGVAPAVDDDHVYYGSENGITALHRDAGGLAWHKDIELGASGGSPIPIGDHVYVSSYNGFAYALDRMTGQVVWKHDLVADAPPDRPGFKGERARWEGIAARPRGATCDGKRLLQSVFDQSRIVAIDCSNGRRAWQFQAEGWIGPAPTIADDRVYVVSQDKHLYCLDVSTGKLIWKYTANTWLASSVAVHRGRVYLPIHRGRLEEIDSETGELIRAFEPPDKADRKGLVYSFPMVTDRTVYFAAGEGQVYAINLETGEMRWQLRPSDDSELFTSLVTDGKRLFVTSRQTGDDAGECAVIAIGP